MTEKTAKNKKYFVFILISIVIIIACLIKIWKTFNPGIDYQSMNNEITEYLNGLNNIKKIKSNEAGIYELTLEDGIWYSAEEKDKASYCLAVNTTISAICQKYKALKDTQKAYIYYYDESGVLIAEPSEKLYSLESKILY
ncbi:hypothetical protein QMP26_02340 [Enterocloster clostridioformis]|uniref:hypothetical protein n=1 Tax=Enterocloster clostridioformis TaxID=1531 RepID=UPI002675FD9F|nr:hypothetical protein [Enterocloster clostridioformis]